MRLDVYKGEELAATFVYGAAPRYYGLCGREIATLIETTPVIYNLWTQECDASPAYERADWWAARIISAPLARAGFVLRLRCADAKPIARQPIRIRLAQTDPAL